MEERPSAALSNMKNCKIEASQRASEGGTMCGHGKRETALRADAIHWLDRVVADVESVKGRAAAGQHRVSIDLINKVAAKIAGHIANGELMVSRADGRGAAGQLVAGAAVGRLS
jgi:hypothetical protein